MVTIRSISVLEVGVTRVLAVITFCTINILNVWFNFAELVGGDISTGATKYFWSQLKLPSKNMLADLSQALSRTLLNFSKKDSGLGDGKQRKIKLSSGGISLRSSWPHYPYC